MTLRFVLAGSLAIALAACGSERQETTPAGSDGGAPGATAPAAAASETPTTDASGTPTPAPSDSAAPTPTPSAAATGATPAPAPAPTSVAAVAPDAFKQCAICHSVESGRNMIGPSLAGVVGRKAGTVAGFAYSPAMKDSGVTWTAANLDKFLADPKGFVPGNKMAFVGQSDAAKRQAIIDYLKTR